ncbi:L-gulonolactone oxidase 3 [Ancistrocladus abbreviatus]
MGSVSWPFCTLISLVSIIWATTTVSTTDAVPPPSPVQCNATGCTIHNAYGIWGDRKDCHAATIAYPKTEEELRRAVAGAHQNKQKVKVVTKFSHTIPKLACPSASETMIISTEDYNSMVAVDLENLAVTVDSGVALRDLINKVEEAGLSLVSAPYWEGVSVGGLISTGAHGSSWWGRGGSVHDHVIGISLVVAANESQGYAKIVRFESRDDELLNAAKVSLGVLGVISKITFSLEPAFKRSITYNFTDDGSIEDEFMEHAKKYEFGDIQWYPSRHTAVYRYDNRVPLDTPGDGLYDFIGFQSQAVLVTHTVRATEKAFESARNMNGKCLMAATFVGTKQFLANGLKNNNLLFTGYPVIGHQAKMQTSGSCLYSSSTDVTSACAWDPRFKGLFFYETTAIFPASKFKDFILDVKRLRDINTQSFCGIDLYNGFLIRFIKASDAYLGQPEDSVVIDFNYFRADDAETPRLNEDILEEVEQMAFFKYGARPHWAKNRNLAFSGVDKKYGNFGKFAAAKRKLDPDNIFSSQWSDEILVGRVGEKGDGCALEGMCVCSEDRHCSPSKGYFCRPGLVYQEARVCRYSPASIVG